LPHIRALVRSAGEDLLAGVGHRLPGGVDDELAWMLGQELLRKIAGEELVDGRQAAKGRVLERVLHGPPSIAPKGCASQERRGRGDVSKLFQGTPWKNRSVRTPLSVHGNASEWQNHQPPLPQENTMMNARPLMFP